MLPADPPHIPSSLQELPPELARFCLSVNRFLTLELGLNIKGASLLAGFSGGADSMALLLILHYLAPSLHLRLTAAHLDHGLRPSSGQEADFCRRFCKRLGIALVSEKRDVAAQSRRNGTGIEEEARAARYDFFKRAALENGCDWTLTGHQNNDLAEDLLMRLIRGAGWPALSGMPALDRSRRLLRPLLLTPRNDIEGFLAALGLGWVHDESNDDHAYLRNRVRLQILPLLLRENPAFLQNTAGLWRLARIDEDYFNSLLLPALPDNNTDEDASAPGAIQTPDSSTLPDAHPDHVASRPAAPAPLLERERLEALPKALRLRLYKKILAELGPGQARLMPLLSLDRSWQAGGEKTIHRFPGGKTAVVDKKNISWSKE